MRQRKYSKGTAPSFTAHFYAPKQSVLVTAAIANAIDYKIGIVNHEDFACCPAIHFIDFSINEHQSADIYFVHIEQNTKQTRKQHYLSLMLSVLLLPRLKDFIHKFATVYLFESSKMVHIDLSSLTSNSPICLNNTFGLYQSNLFSLL